MECIAICRICGVKVSFKEGNIFMLGEHLIKKHPEIEMTHFVLQDCGGDGLHKSRSRKLTKLSRKLSSSASSLWKKSSTLIKDKKKKSGPHKRNMYKTTVESWHPGSAPLACPKCGNTGQPYIRKQRNKVAYNSLGAFFLLGCWPLCFLPMMCGSTTTTVCCRKCGYCFGTYDNKKGKLNPMNKGPSANGRSVEEPLMEREIKNTKTQQNPVAKMEQTICLC